VFDIVNVLRLFSYHWYSSSLMNYSFMNESRGLLESTVDYV
jgi:hypothetical protein